MKYPVDLMLGFMTLSTALIVIAGFVMSYLATREKQTDRDIVIFILSGLSAFVGTIAMVNILLWFGNEPNWQLTFVKSCIIIQAFLVIIPLFSQVSWVITKRKK